MPLHMPCIDCLYPSGDFDSVDVITTIIFRFCDHSIVIRGLHAVSFGLASCTTAWPPTSLGKRLQVFFTELLLLSNAKELNELSRVHCFEGVLRNENST